MLLKYLIEQRLHAKISARAFASVCFLIILASSSFFFFSSIIVSFHRRWASSFDIHFRDFDEDVVALTCCFCIRRACNCFSALSTRSFNLWRTDDSIVETNALFKSDIVYDESIIDRARWNCKELEKKIDLYDNLYDVKSCSRRAKRRKRFLM